MKNFRLIAADGRHSDVIFGDFLKKNGKIFGGNDIFCIFVASNLVMSGSPRVRLRLFFMGNQKPLSQDLSRCLSCKRYASVVFPLLFSPSCIYTLLLFFQVQTLRGHQNIYKECLLAHEYLFLHCI